MSDYVVNVVTVALGDPGADNKQLFALQAPTTGNGGGLRIVEASAVNGASITNSLGVGGTTFTLALHKYSSAGTPAVNGTIAAAIGGTAVGWTAGVPQSFTLNSTYSYLSAGEWLVLQYNELNSGNPTNGYAQIKYVMGK